MAVPSVPFGVVRVVAGLVPPSEGVPGDPLFLCNSLERNVFDESLVHTDKKSATYELKKFAKTPSPPGLPPGV